jgi:hypothetical protein
MVFFEMLQQHFNPASGQSHGDASDHFQEVSKAAPRGRDPTQPGRMINLLRAAAGKRAMLGTGLMPVKLEVVAEVLAIKLRSRAAGRPAICDS